MKSVKVYRTMMDAWHAGVRDWCIAASGRAFDGGRTICVVNHPGQMRWMKAQLLNEGLGAMGLYFLDLPRLRTEIARLTGKDLHLLGAESLEFLLGIETGGDGADPLRSNLRPAVRALDEVVAAKGVEVLEGADFFPEKLRAFGHALAGTGYWAPAVDVALADESFAAVAGLNVLVLGLDARCFSSLRLLHALSRLASAMHAYLPAPGISGEGPGQKWVDAVAHTLGCEWEICTDSGTPQWLDDRAAMFNGSVGLNSSDAGVEAVQAEDEAAQTGVILDAVQRMLAGGNSSPSEPVGILFPGRCPQAAAVKDRLVELGVVVLDELRELPVMPPGAAMVRSILDCISSDYDAGAFLKLTQCLERIRHPDWQSLSSPQARDWLEQGFRISQSRDTRVALRAASTTAGTSRIDPRVLEAMKTLLTLVSGLPAGGTWEEYADAWKKMLGHFDLTVDLLEPLWSRIGQVAGARSIRLRDFLDFVAVMVEARPARVDPAASHGFAKVILSDFQKAGGRRWSGLICAESHDGGWPNRPVENAFLSDERKVELNLSRAGGIPLLTKSNLAALQDAAFVDLVQNCDGPLVFCMAARDPAAPSRERFPNAWMSLAGKIAAGGLRRIRCMEPGQQLLQGGGGGFPELARVHASRLDPAMPFDDWMFSPGPEDRQPRPWNATALDTALLFPATFVLQHYLRCEPGYTGSMFERSAAPVQGTVTHRWLSAVARASGENGTAFPPADAAALLLRFHENLMGELRDYFLHRDELPAWWLAVLERARWQAGRCLEAVEAALPGWSLHPEKSLHARVKLSACETLELKGRMDLVISDQPAPDLARHVRVVDYKTGTTADPLTEANLGKGRGMQFAGYYGILSAFAPAAGLAVERVMSWSRKSESLPMGREQIEQLLLPLARLQSGRKFGMTASAAANEHARVEVLPLACSPVPDAVLRKKRELWEATSPDRD